MEVGERLSFCIDLMSWFKQLEFSYFEEYAASKLINFPKERVYLFNPFIALQVLLKWKRHLFAISFLAIHCFFKPLNKTPMFLS